MNCWCLATRVNKNRQRSSQLFYSIFSLERRRRKFNSCGYDRVSGQGAAAGRERWQEKGGIRWCDWRTWPCREREYPQQLPCRVICLSAVVASSSSEQIVDDVFFSLSRDALCSFVLRPMFTHTHTAHEYFKSCRSHSSSSSTSCGFGRLLHHHHHRRHQSTDQCEWRSPVTAQPSLA